MVLIGREQAGLESLLATCWRAGFHVGTGSGWGRAPFCDQLHVGLGAILWQAPWGAGRHFVTGSLLGWAGLRGQGAESTLQPLSQQQWGDFSEFFSKGWKTVSLQVFPEVQRLAWPHLGSPSAFDQPAKWQVQTVPKEEEVANNLCFLQN